MVSFELKIKVKYELRGTTKAELKAILGKAAEFLANEGLLSGETSAEVVEWDFKVKEERRSAKPERRRRRAS